MPQVCALPMAVSKCGVPERRPSTLTGYAKFMDRDDGPCLNLMGGQHDWRFSVYAKTVTGTFKCHEAA